MQPRRNQTARVGTVMIPLMWPLATGEVRTLWAAPAVEHMAGIIMTRSAGWPEPEANFPAQALDLARQFYDAIERRVDELGRPPRPDVLRAHCGARPFFPYPTVPDEEAWLAICDTCGNDGLVSGSSIVPAGTGR